MIMMLVLMIPVMMILVVNLSELIAMIMILALLILAIALVVAVIMLKIVTITILVLMTTVLLNLVSANTHTIPLMIRITVPQIAVIPSLEPLPILLYHAMIIAFVLTIPVYLNLDVNLLKSHVKLETVLSRNAILVLDANILNLYVMILISVLPIIAILKLEIVSM